ncbi:MAG TPA: iron-containing alcohol dehydrogenase [Oscillospiraceae bacterium]|nr:iron-containing alcohol dehydrogenase [Oscillospiraceae bacterium]
MGIHRVNSVSVSFFGKGSISLLPDELKKRNLKRALIITDSFLYESGTAEKVGNELLKAGIEYAIYYRVQPNPTVEIINECICAAKSLDVDFLVAVGGGSAIDTSKAAGIVLTNGGRVEQYEGLDKSKNPALPVVAINTTAGTGSEVTSFYVVTNPLTHSKMVMVDPNCMVSIAVNDCDFMMSMPKGLTAATGMDAMTHSIEAVLSCQSTPLTDKDALWCIKTIKDYLPRAVQNGNDIEAREMMAYAEYTAGMAFSNGGLGMVHAMAHSLGGFYNLPHGICNSILLPYVMEYNGQAETVQKKFTLIAEALEIDGTKKMQPVEAMKACVQYIRDLCRNVGIPSGFSEFKVKKEDFSALADLALADTCMPANPIRPTKNDIISVYEKAY